MAVTTVRVSALTSWQGKEVIGRALTSYIGKSRSEFISAQFLFMPSAEEDRRKASCVSEVIVMSPVNHAHTQKNKHEIKIKSEVCSSTYRKHFAMLSSQELGQLSLPSFWPQFKLQLILVFHFS